MKFLIVGPGAMGCLFAARLKKAGHDVTLFDHIEKRADLINKQGIKVEGILGEYSVHVPTVTGKIADFPDQGYKLVRVGQAPLLGLELLLSLGRIPSKGQDVLETLLLHLSDDLFQLVHGMAHTGEVSHDVETLLSLKLFHHLDRALSGGPSGPIGD